MAIFPRSLEKYYLVTTVQNTAGVKTNDLHPYQLGLFDAKTWLSTTAPAQQMVLAVGSPHKGQQKVSGKLGNFANVGSINKSFKTVTFNKGGVIEAKHIKAQPDTQNYIGYLGWNGLTGNSLFFECSKSYFVNIHVEGSPVDSLFGKCLDETVTVATDCCADCATGCVTTDMQEKYVDTLVRKINIENPYLNRFLKAHKVVTWGTPPAAIPHTVFNTYCMDVCDEGDSIALARVQSKYTQKITRKSREGSTTTYSFQQIATAPAPAAFSLANVKLSDCAVCPAGFTTVTGGKVYNVAIDNAGNGVNAAAWLAEVQAVAGLGTATSAERISYKNGTSTYVVVFPTAFVAPASPANDTVLTFIGTQDNYCVQTTPATYTWSVCDTCYKIIRKAQCTVTDPDCGGANVLTEMIAQYANVSDIVPGSIVVSTLTTPNADGCKTVYELQQYSDCLQDGCDWTAEMSFQPIDAFKGFVWTPETISTSGTGTVKFGIKFEVTYEQVLPEGAAYSAYDELNTNPIFVWATFGEFDARQYQCVQKNVSYQIAQYPKVENLRGHKVLNELIKTALYDGIDFIDQNYKLQSAEGLAYLFGIKPNSYYDLIKLSVRDFVQEYTHPSHDAAFDYYFVVESGDVVTQKAVVSMINKVLNKNEVDLIL